MESLSPEIIDKLFAYPALLGFGYLIWIHSKVMLKMLEIINEFKKKD